MRLLGSGAQRYVRELKKINKKITQSRKGNNQLAHAGASHTLNYLPWAGSPPKHYFHSPSVWLCADMSARHPRTLSPTSTPVWPGGLTTPLPPLPLPTPTPLPPRPSALFCHNYQVRNLLQKNQWRYRKHQ